MNIGMADRFFIFVGAHFTKEIYLSATKIQGILWSISDIVFIYFVLKIVSFVLQNENNRRIYVRFVLLWLSAALVPFLILTGNSRQFFILESIIFGLQFTVLFYTAVFDIRRMMEFFRNFVSGC